MSDSYTYHAVTRVRHEWRVSGATCGGWGTPVAELHKALAAAETKYRDVFHVIGNLHDDWLRVYAADDEVVLWFEEER